MGIKKKIRVLPGSGDQYRLEMMGILREFIFNMTSMIFQYGKTCTRKVPVQLNTTTASKLNIALIICKGISLPLPSDNNYHLIQKAAVDSTCHAAKILYSRRPYRAAPTAPIRSGSAGEIIRARPPRRSRSICPIQGLRATPPEKTISSS